MINRNIDNEDRRKNMSWKEIMVNGREKDTRLCKLCGNRHPLTAEYFMIAQQSDEPGICNQGLLLVCRICRAHWDNWQSDFRVMCDIARKRGSAAIYINSYAEMFGRKRDTTKQARKEWLEAGVPCCQCGTGNFHKQGQAHIAKDPDNDRKFLVTCWKCFRKGGEEPPAVVGGHALDE